MTTIAKYSLEWRGERIAPGAAIEATTPEEERRLWELRRAWAVAEVDMPAPEPPEPAPEPPKEEPAPQPLPSHVGRRRRSE
jgi:hypothetical protein